MNCLFLSGPTLNVSTAHAYCIAPISAEVSQFHLIMHEQQEILGSSAEKNVHGVTPSSLKWGFGSGK